LAIYTDDVGVLSLIKDLGIGRYEKTQFIEKINTASDRLSTDERACLILLIADNYGLYFKGVEPKDMPNLLTDEQGQTISSRSQALLPPERSKFRLPANIKINFVSEDLSRLLREKANVTRARELASKLNRFNLDEYRFDTVIRRIVAVTAKLIKNNARSLSE